MFGKKKKKEQVMRPPDKRVYNKQMRNIQLGMKKQVLARQETQKQHGAKEQIYGLEQKKQKLSHKQKRIAERAKQGQRAFKYRSMNVGTPTKPKKKHSLLWLAIIFIIIIAIVWVVITQMR